MYNQPETIIEQYDFTVSQITKGRGTYICETNQGMKLLTPFRGSKERAEFLENTLSYLLQEAFEVEQFYRTKEGELLSTDEAGEHYILKDMFCGTECNTRNAENMKEAVKKLAVFHNLIAGYKSEIPEFMKGNRYRMLELFEKHNRGLIKVKNFVKTRKQKNEFERCFAQNYAHFMEHATKAIEILSNMSQERWNYLLCHGDFNQHNVIWTPEGVRFVNFETMNYNIPMWDLGNFIRKMLEKNNWNPNLGHQLIETYAETRPLDEMEKKQLYILLLYPEKFWKISNYYYNSSKTWGAKRSLEKLEKIIEVEPQRMEFIENLFSF